MSAITDAAEAVLDLAAANDPDTSATDIAVALGRVAIEQAEAGAGGGGGVVEGEGVAGTPAGGVLTVQGVSGGTVLPVGDGGGSLTVDGSLTTVSTVTAVTSVTNPVTIQDGGGSITVDGALSFTAAAPDSVFHGVVTIATAGTEVTLGASQALQFGVTVRSSHTNTGLVYVGVVGVSSADGYVLQPGESVFVPVANRATVFVDAAVNGSTVSYIAS